MSHPFAEALLLHPEGEGRARAVVPEAMGQGRATFGGLVIALAVRAAGPLLGEAPLRSALMSFVGPVAPGAVQLSWRLLRRGRSLCQVEVEVLQGGEVAALVQLAAGPDRPTALTVLPDSPPPPPMEDAVEMPFLPSLTPDFTQHFRYLWRSPGLPYQGLDSDGIDGEVGLREATPVDAAVLLALLDAWPAPTLARARRPLPISSASWLVHLIEAPPPGGWPAGWMGRFRSRTISSRAGFIDMDSQLWGPEGRLVATSRQVVAEFSLRS